MPFEKTAFPAQLRAAFGLMLVLIFLGSIAVGGFFVWRFIQVDRCLDSGGRWNANVKACELPQSPT